MVDYNELRRKIVRFLKESGMSAYDLCRVSKDLCCCRTCKFFVQHYAKSGNEVDFGHCIKNTRIKPTRPHENACGFWSHEEGGADE